jgi:glycosyltransferase involved in cell wall biosynthesis
MVNQLRTLIVVRWPAGGIRTHLKYVYPLLVQKLGGMQVTLMSLRMDELEMLKRDLASLNVNFVELDNRCTGIQFARAVNREIGGGKFDLIHSHGFTAACAAAVPAKLRRVPHLATIHDILHDSHFGPKGILRRLGFRLLLNMPDALHAVGDDAGKNLMTQLGPGIGSRLRVARNGILTEAVLQAAPRDLRGELNLEVSSFLIGFFGRFMSQKGFRYLAEAVGLLRDRNRAGMRRVHVVTFGEGNFIREEQAALEKAGLRAQFSFMPYLQNVASTLKSVDVVAIPSVWETMPLLPMEAMVAGVPVIGTSCTGLREVLADSPSTIIPPRDPMALAQALEREANRSSRAVAEHFIPRAVERFDVADQVSKLSELIGHLIAK